MPAYTFEKISAPPVVRTERPAPIVESKQRGGIVQLLGRLTDTRGQRMQRASRVGFSDEALKK